MKVADKRVAGRLGEQMTKATQMNWNVELAYFITPKAGPMRPMQTLLDANRAMLDDVPTRLRRQAHWIRAGKHLLAATERGTHRGHIEQCRFLDVIDG